MSGGYYQTSFSQNQQPVQCWNIGSEDIPQYGVTHIEKVKYSSVDRQLQYDVRLFTEADAKLQVHQRVAINISETIQANSKGYATLSLPSVALIGRYGTAKTMPEDFSTVGPGKDSFHLWKGGLTHTLLCITNRTEVEDDDEIEPLGIVTPDTSPGGWVRFDGTLAGSDTAVVTGSSELVWIKRNPDDNGGTFELAKSKDINGVESTMIVRYDHAKGDVTNGEYGQIKLTSGHWALDVEYCG